MKKRRSAYWTLFNAVRERLLTDVVKFIKPGMLRESLGITPRRKLPHSETCAYERYWTNWFWEFSEINATVDRTDHVLIYLSHYPGSRAFRGLSEADWLRYHVEVYLQEIYVLNERLKRFLKKVEKISIAARDKSGIISIRTLTAHVDLALKNAVSVRGGHVHRCRFDPEELHQLDGLVLFTKAGKLAALRPFRKLHYKKTLIKWCKQFRENNRAIAKLCEYIFEESTRVLVRNEPPK